MTKKAYLCCTNHPEIYPSFGYEAYNPRVHAIASGVRCIPITWLTLFGSDSMVTQPFVLKGHEVLQVSADGSSAIVREETRVTLTAPFASRVLCLERIAPNIERLELLLALKPGTIKEYGDCLFKAVQDAQGEYITLEVAEVACLQDESEFYANLAMVLNWLDGEENPDARMACLSLGDLDLTRPILSPTGFDDEEQEIDDQDYRNRESLIGSSVRGIFPWEH